MGHGRDVFLYSEIRRSFEGLWKEYYSAGWSSHWRRQEVIQEKHLQAVPIIKLWSLSSNQFNCTTRFMIGSANRKCQKETARLKQEEGACHFHVCVNITPGSLSLASAKSTLQFFPRLVEPASLPKSLLPRGNNSLCINLSVQIVGVVSVP